MVAATWAKPFESEALHHVIKNADIYRTTLVERGLMNILSDDVVPDPYGRVGVDVRLMQCSVTRSVYHMQILEHQVTRCYTGSRVRHGRRPMCLAAVLDTGRL